MNFFVKIPLGRLLLASLVGIGFLVFTGTSFPQSNYDIACGQVYQGFLGNDQQVWKEGIATLTTLNQQAGGKDAKVLYRLTSAEYGMVGFCLAKKQTKDIDAQIQRVEGHAKTLSQLSGYAGAGKAFLGGLMGLKIGLNPAKGIYLGPQSSGYLDAATKASPNDPTTWIELANSKYHAPVLFGGDKAQAAEYFKKAIALFDKQPELRKNNWLYLHAWAWLGKSYEDLGRHADAVVVYQKALAYEPRFTWVRDELLPMADNMR